MGFIARAVFVAVLLGVAVLIQKYRLITRPIPPPQIDEKQYWGPGKSSNYKEDPTIKPFDITTNAQIIETLKEELNRPLRLHEPIDGVAFEYGFNSNYLKQVVTYWRDTYLPKWGERETFLKKFPHFQTQIQGLRIHFLHVKPKKTGGKNVVPLLLLHGWPGSVREFYDIIPLLTTPNTKSDYVFEVIAPSLPGYGWSQGSAKVDFATTQIAVVLRNLMLRVGHDKFLVQGGDWGSIIGGNMAALFPQNVLGYHSNMCNALNPINTLLTRLVPPIFIPAQYRDFHPPLGELFSYLLEETGYMHLQATKPDTIGSVLLYNPVGLAAYILEKFSTWTNVEYKKLADGGLTRRYSLDALLDNVMIYYVTNCITTSQRLYAEELAEAHRALEIARVAILPPSACARFKHDLMHATDFELKDRFVNLLQSTYHPDGGHFAAFEVPQQLYDDFVSFVNKALKTSS